MKSFLVLTAVLFISMKMVKSVPQPHPPPGPMTEEMEKNLEECRVENGLTKGENKLYEEEHEFHRKHDFNNEKMRCMPACLMKKDGILQAGNNIDIGKMVEKTAERFKNVPEEAKKAFEECSEKAKEKQDECEVAHTFVDCVHRKIKPGPMSSEE